MHDWPDLAEGAWKRNVGKSQSFSRPMRSLSELMDEAVCEQGGVVHGRCHANVAARLQASSEPDSAFMSNDSSLDVRNGRDALRPRPPD
jgi:hypothetical protein